MINDEYELYLDESGSTGNNWLDLDQEILVHGGWLIEKKNKEKVEKYLNSKKIEITQADEMKSKKIFKNEQSYGIFCNMFTEMVNIPCFPFVCVTDKKFISCGRIVETFFDSMYNKKLLSTIISDFDLKQKIAKCIFLEHKDVSESDNIMNIFVKSIFSLEDDEIKIEDMKVVKEKLADIFNNKISSIYDNVTNITDEELIEMLGEFKQKSSLDKDLLEPSLTVLLQSVEEFSNKTSASSVCVIHDNLRDFEKKIDLSKKQMQDRHVNPIFIGDKNIYPCYNKIKEIKNADSKKEIMIQASDLLCGFIRKTYKSSEKTNTDNPIGSVWSLLSLSDSMLGFQLLNIIDTDRDTIDYKCIEKEFIKHIK